MELHGLDIFFHIFSRQGALDTLFGMDVHSLEFLNAVEHLLLLVDFWLGKTELEFEVDQFFLELDFLLGERFCG